MYPILLINITLKIILYTLLVEYNANVVNTSNTTAKINTIIFYYNFNIKMLKIIS